jgi:dTDP-4-dehydrorhamnose 3,5-epimerase
MEVVPLQIPDIKIIKPARFSDERGFFSETYNAARFAEHGLTFEFVQDNHSYSVSKGVVRGLHFQTAPHAQTKLVRVVRGAIFDVAVDLRLGSPTYGRHVSAIISADEWNQILVPAGFAHGLCTLKPHTEVLYKVTDFYSRSHDAGIRWDDPELRIDWPVTREAAVVSAKDASLPLLADIEPPFSHDAQ